MEKRTTDQGAPTGSPLATSEPWDLVADGYTVDFRPLMEQFASEALQLALLPPSPRIVDVATGPGTLALLAARQGATVSAIDFSPAMVANLRRGADEAGLIIADVRVGDGQDLPYEDDAFDGAFSLLGLVFFPDRAAGFRELRRVLGPGRRAVISAPAPFEGPFALVLNSIGAVLPDPPGAEGRSPLSDPDGFRREMTAAGFREVKVRTISGTLTKPSLSDYWDLVQRSAAPVVLLRRKLGEERWAEVANDVFNRLHQTLGDGPVEDIYTIHLGVGVK